MIFYDLHVLSFIGLQDLVYLKYVKTEQPPDVLYEKGCSEKFCKIHRKTSVSKSSFLIKLQD